MKFGKHLLSSALPEWIASYLDYKALKRAIKVQAQTGAHPLPIQMFARCENPL